jgi:hypothetical protein
MKLLARPSKTKSGGLLFMLTLAALLFVADEAGARSKQSEAKANMKAVFTPEKALSSGTKMPTSPNLLGGSGGTGTAATGAGQTNKTRVDPYKNYNFR